MTRMDENMHDEEDDISLPGRPGREPVFNLPAIIVWLVGVLVAIHAVRVFLLPVRTDNWLTLVFAFIPARYGAEAAQLPVPAAALWSPVTYAFLHGGWSHLFMNSLWMVAFGSPVARRLGTIRFVLLSVITAIAGAAAHYISFPGELLPVIGASAMVSGYMGAAARFAFQPHGPGLLNVNGPAMTLTESFTNSRFLIFLVVWFALNLLFGSGIVMIGGVSAAIAWQAHIGGFFAGILVFSLLDPPRT
jgi:membrane associated rhomboid family serine protease